MKTMDQKRIGIMGGTFNPVHIGHLILAENAYEQFCLESVLIMPSKNPPHKKHIHIVSDYHRTKMVELSILDNSHLELSRVELDREGITYTCDTLLQLKKDNPNIDYYFIVGTDSLFEMERWMKPEIIFELAIIVVAKRDNIKDDDLILKIDYLKEKYNGTIEVLYTPNIDISSHLIRDKVHSGSTICYYVLPQVNHYINENKLYK